MTVFAERFFFPWEKVNRCFFFLLQIVFTRVPAVRICGANVAFVVTGMHFLPNKMYRYFKKPNPCLVHKLNEFFSPIRLKDSHLRTSQFLRMRSAFSEIWSEGKNALGMPGVIWSCATVCSTPAASMVLPLYHTKSTCFTEPLCGYRVVYGSEPCEYERTWNFKHHPKHCEQETSNTIWNIAREIAQFTEVQIGRDPRKYKTALTTTCWYALFMFVAVCWNPFHHKFTRGNNWKRICHLKRMASCHAPTSVLPKKMPLEN